MKRSGPTPKWTEQVNVVVGQSINELWTVEAEESKLKKSILARVALGNFFEDPSTIITLLTAQPGEPIHSTSIGVTPAQLELIDERATLLQTSTTHIASMVVASRYIAPAYYHSFNVRRGVPANLDVQIPLF